jgi:predicted nucleotide-binding protein (sugar kinase/HSP70/actin superfamily)
MAASTSGTTLYIPPMCDHCYALAAAFRAVGQRAVVMPPSDDATLARGLEFCRGRECSPCLLVTGDLVRQAREPDFDPARAVLFMATTTGSCRFGQYATLLRHTLERLGLGEVAVVGPSANDSYQGLGADPVRLRRLIWQGAVAVDLLQKLLHSRRPYEREAGATDAAYERSLADVVAAVEAGAGARLVAAMELTAERFAALPVDRSARRPLIGVVGEIYLRHNRFGNLEIVRRVEALGGEVDLASIAEWIYYTNWGHLDDSWILGQRLEWAKTALMDGYQRVLERRLVRPVRHLLDRPYEPHIGELVAHIGPYYSPDLANECVLSMGKAVELAKLGASGIINVMPFACMPGVITAGLAPRIRADLDNLPWLDIAFDAQGGTNITTRLEAFMYQAAEFQRRHAHA